MIGFLGNIQVTEDDMDLLERLAEADGVNSTVFIYDKVMSESLRRAGYVNVNNIGWVWGTNLLRQVLPRLKKTLMQECQFGEG
jgi:hypothetical protein